MKKVKSDTTDERRPEYQRSDFGKIVRGNYANLIKEESNHNVDDMGSGVKQTID